jgi:6-phosphogluconolactonase
VANYASGSIAALPIAANGALGPAASTIQHSGKGHNPQRQEGPHAHCIQPDPSNRFVVAVDLGIDQVLVYQLDIERVALMPRPTGNYRAQPGHGPRHIAFHPAGKHAFIIQELGNQLTSCRWDASAGAFAEIESLPTLPADFNGNNSTAEVLVHPNGKFVFGSNRGHDSIVTFAFDAASEKLKPVGHTSTAGRTLRNFRLDPSGQFLLAANQDSNSIVVFRVDEATGQLTQVGQPITVGAPCCIKFLR